MKTKSNKLKIASAIGLGILFNVIFWKEKPGINYLIYTATLTGILTYLHPTNWKSKTVILSGIALGLSLLGILWTNSTLSIWMFFITLLTFIGFFHDQKLRAVYYALVSSLSNIFGNFSTLAKLKSEKEDNNSNQQKVRKKLKLIVIPLIITTVFFFIYSAANPIIGEYTAKVLHKLGQYLEDIFENFSLVRVWFLCIGLIAGSYFVFFRGNEQISERDLSEKDTIYRKSTNKTAFTHLLSLLNEYKTAFLTFLMLNTLIFLVIITDLWQLSSFSFNKSLKLADNLHQGTFLLIISLLLSIGVVVYYFRGNLNFIKDNKKVKLLSHIWITQNFILAVIVGIKCLLYIHFHGLAYKRIGVLIFLLITSFGLSLMYIKISRNKSVFYLLKNTSWCALLTLALLSTINIDKVIIENNINHQYPSLIDFSFLLDLSDKSLPLLIQNKEVLETQNHYCMHNRNVKTNLRNQQLTEILENRIEQFKRNQSQYSWLSWNYADYSTLKALSK